jgi:hypothetical protein
MQRISRETLKGKRVQTKSGKENTKFTIENIIEREANRNANEQR